MILVWLLLLVEAAYVTGVVAAFLYLTGQAVWGYVMEDRRD